MQKKTNVAKQFLLNVHLHPHTPLGLTQLPQSVQQLMITMSVLQAISNGCYRS